MRIVPDSSIAVIIDMQERLLPHMDGADALLDRCRLLIRGLELLSVPVFRTEQYPKGLGRTVVTIADEWPAQVVIEKRSFSCYDEVDFTRHLSGNGRKTILIAGIETHVCILQTVLDLIDHEYVPVVVADCVASRTAEDRHFALKRIFSEGGRVSTAESVLFELMRTSLHPNFREVSRLVK